MFDVILHTTFDSEENAVAELQFRNCIQVKMRTEGIYPRIIASVQKSVSHPLIHSVRFMQVELPRQKKLRSVSASG